MAARIIGANLRGITIGSASPPIQTPVLDDTFVATDGTLLVDHTQVIGSSWSMLGTGSENESAVIYSNMLRRPTNEEVDPNFSWSSGESIFYNTANIPTNEFYVEYNIQFTSEANPCAFSSGRTSPNEIDGGYLISNSDVFSVIQFNDTSSNYIQGQVDGIATNVFTNLNTFYTIKHVFTGTDCQTYLNGSLLFTEVIGADWFTNKIGFDLYDNAGSAVININNITVRPL